MQEFLFEGENPVCGFEYAVLHFGGFFGLSEYLFAQWCPEILGFADEEGIDAGMDSQEDGLEGAEPIDDGVHFEVVADDDALKPELFAQDIGDDHGGQRGWESFAESVHDDVGGHDHGNIGFDGGFEGFEFDVLESIHVVVDFGEIGVAVEEGVSVPREVFSAGDDAAVDEALHGGDGEFDDLFRRRSEGASGDDGILGIGVNIEDRCEVDVKSERFEIARIPECDISGIFGCCPGDIHG